MFATALCGASANAVWLTVDLCHCGHMLQVIERTVGAYTVSSDRTLLDVEVVHRYLSQDSYWARGRERDVMESAITNSALMVGAYTSGGEQVGFARMVTDCATFAWLCDVFVLDEHQGNGLGIAIVSLAVEHPAVAGIKRQMLATRDAHELYTKFGYSPIETPEKWMERRSSV